MPDIIKLTATDGSTVEFFNEISASGGMKDMYWCVGKKEVVLFFRNKIDANAKDRLNNIVGLYYEKIFNQEGGEYWKNLFCWPYKMVDWNGKMGLVCPAYQSKFFFADGNFKGKEKNGKWFTSAKLRGRFLRPQDKGTWLSHYHMLIKIARAVKRLHAAGLAHSDLSYNNVLVDPATGSACIIDCDTLVVPGKYPPEVVGTPDFIAPEVLQTQALKVGDPNKKLPCRATDLHALAVMIYMNLLYRHPLRGSKVHDVNDERRDEALSMGEKALFIEHPSDKSNRVKPGDLTKAELPYADPARLPYTICGPYLKDLFDRAFITALHNPSLRPTADEWEQALVKTTDLMQPCQNPNCEAKWFVFDNTTKPRCPFCGTEYHGQLPVLNFYYSPKNDGHFIPENSRLMVYDKQTLYMWHVNRFIVANEKTKPEDKKPAGDFHFHNGQWILINRRLPDLWDKTENKQIPVGGFVPLTEGRKILLSKDNGGRLIIVQLVKN
ncbi:MAG: kinase [Muribaculaceae bacterium]|nr:kinase [Muribaculaceae bacterium]